MVEVAGRVAIVSGGARGIGAGTCARLAQDGFAVAVLDLVEAAAKSTAEAINSHGGQAIAVGCDVTDAADVDAAVERVVETLGPPSVLVNNAGITRDNLLFKMSETDWDSVICVHLRGAFLLSRAVQTHMVKQRWGRIVNVSSTAALGNRGQVNYSAAKAGLQGFTKTLAIELGEFGVTANCVAPGFVVTDMTRSVASRIGQDWDVYVATRAAQIPVRRVGQIEDIANAVSFFASPASGFVSGQVLYVAGGPKA
ncbi:SDR family oxidoreductase [Nocardia sp. NPDC059239]|uniref:SDR family oxidoreductase n=1 Tax=unclassified Nocardia TaxID=2637762 RepID=UPI0036826082